MPAGLGRFLLLDIQGNDVLSQATSDAARIVAPGTRNDLGLEFIVDVSATQRLSIAWYLEFGGQSVTGFQGQYPAPVNSTVMTGGFGYREQSEENAGSGAISHFDITRTITIPVSGVFGSPLTQRKYFPFVVFHSWARVTMTGTLEAGAATGSLPRVRVSAILDGFTS